MIILRDALYFFFIIPTYSEDTLTTAVIAYCNSDYTSIWKYTYAFDILASTLSY
jgi:hypothetical protein